MTEGEENIIIKGVLLEAISRDFSEELSNNKEVSVSPRFKRQMMAMMNNPNKWAERHKRDYICYSDCKMRETGSARVQSQREASLWPNVYRSGVPKSVRSGRN